MTVDTKHASRRQPETTVTVTAAIVEYCGVFPGRLDDEPRTADANIHDPIHSSATLEQWSQEIQAKRELPTCRPEGYPSRAMSRSCRPPQ